MLDNIRFSLGRAIESFYNRLEILPSPNQMELIKDINDKVMILCEHQSFFPHLGAYRLPLMACNKYCNGDNFVLFIINDMYYRNTSTDTRHLGIYSMGQSYLRQPNPIVVPCSKRKALHIAKPPDEVQIEKIGNQIKSKYDITFNWLTEMKGVKVKTAVKKAVRKSIDYNIELMNKCRIKTTTYSDWCILINYEFYKSTNPFELNNILFVSHSDLIREFGEILNTFIEDSEKFVKVINKVIAIQRDGGEKPFLAKRLDDKYTPFWHICKICGYRSKVTKGSKYEIQAYCESCKSTSEVVINHKYSYTDVIGKQTLATFFKPKIRVVGKINPYSKVVDTCAEAIYGLDVPKRVVLPSKPIFHGLGTPEGGAPDMSVFGSLIESSPNTIGSALVSPNWVNNPIIKSNYL